MSDTPTTSSLVTTKVIAVSDVDQLVAAYAAHPRSGWLSLGKRYKLDVYEAISRNLEVAVKLSDPSCIGGWRQSMIRRAVLMAQPTKA